MQSNKDIQSNKDMENNNEDIEICDECDCIINCLKENIYILSRGTEEKVWCSFCLDVLGWEAANDGWEYE